MRFRLNCLTELIDVTRGRVPDELTGHAGKTLERAGQRLRWGEQTIVALAGSTGSGKSSLTNALVRSDVAEAGVLRPTTAETLAVSFGNTNAELLDWLQIKHRREVPVGQNGFGGMVLLDLPDHDSMVSAHRAEVDRMVPVVDQLIWVLDPQKYADAAVHHGYLKPLSRHGEVMVVVLNQVDRIRAADLDDCLAHLGQLLDSDGLAGVPLFATSIATGVGIDALREHLADVVAGKRAARTRLSVDLDQLAGQFEVVCRAGPEKPGEEDIEVLEAGLLVPYEAPEEAGSETGDAEVDGEVRAGARVSLVEGGSPADKAGLKKDDVIIAIDGKTTSKGSALTGYVRQYSANDKVKLTVIRDSKKQDIDVTLAERKDS